MGEEEVYLASSPQNLADLLRLDAIQLRVQIERAQLRDEEFEVGPRRRAVRYKVWVQAHTHEQSIRLRFVPIELNKRVEDFTVDKSLLFEGFERLTEIHDYTALSALSFLISTAAVTDQATAEEVVGHPEDGTQHRKAPKVLLVYLLK